MGNLIEQLKYIAVVLFLAIATYQDIKNREISIRLCLAFAFVGVTLNMMEWYFVSDFGVRAVVQRVEAMLPGIIILVISILSDEHIGAGDGVVIIIMGMFMGVSDTVMTICLSMLLVGVVSLVLLLAKRVNRNQSFPFVPYIFIITTMCIINSHLGG